MKAGSDDPKMISYRFIGYFFHYSTSIQWNWIFSSTNSVFFTNFSYYLTSQNRLISSFMLHVALYVV
jgi:hypothetical protein